MLHSAARNHADIHVAILSPFPEDQADNANNDSRGWCCGDAHRGQDLHLSCTTIFLEINAKLLVTDLSSIRTGSPGGTSLLLIYPTTKGCI